MVSDKQTLSPAMELMVERKAIKRKQNELSFSDPEYTKLQTECDRLLSEAQTLGGLNADEAQVLAYCY